MSDYKAFNVVLADKVAHVVINRPEKVNAMNADFWREIIEIFQWVDDTDAVRVAVRHVDLLAQGLVAVKSLRDGAGTQRTESLSTVAHWAHTLQSAL